ncbi:MAG TPA: DNA polymerase III subunit gamma/tau [Candidatus Paceibacterota bacterium]|nr:DNA polymerase III subunit gamma/tau [Candidatus Paceibacterota bacterium]
MSQSLYRAYRPATFAEVRGQEQVTNALQEAIASGKVGHAYLFAGSRGLGKTSIARIFANELKVSDKDLYEIDAASNTGVDNIRSLNENVHTLPFESPYKFYILDEAHMLSKSAWNALLKTLEEPPPYIVFVLATTEATKVPETVLSRCQVFEFKKPAREGLAKLVLDVSKKEGYTVDPSAADLIALLAEGSYRDALSILERVLSASSDKNVSRENAEKATGAPKGALVEALVRALSEGDKGAALVTVHTAEKQSVDMGLFLTLVTEYARNVLLVRHAPELRADIQKELGESYADVEAVAKAEGSKLTHKTLIALLDAASMLRYSPVPALPLELAIHGLSE